MEENKKCSFCETIEADCSYLNTVMCYECFVQQMSHYYYDKYYKNLSVDEIEELDDFINEKGCVIHSPNVG